eukprot:1385077-Pyramimonas_sp.AAC.1
MQVAEPAVALGPEGTGGPVCPGAREPAQPRRHPTRSGVARSENGEPAPTPHDPGRDREAPDSPSSAWSLSAKMWTSGPLNAQQ